MQEIVAMRAVWLRSRWSKLIDGPSWPVGTAANGAHHQPTNQSPTTTVLEQSSMLRGCSAVTTLALSKSLVGGCMAAFGA